VIEHVDYTQKRGLLKRVPGNIGGKRKNQKVSGRFSVWNVTIQIPFLEEGV
jgi:hypothetical protein